MPCPIETELRDFARGAVTDERWRELAEHLDVCPDCERRLEELDSFPAVIRSPDVALADDDPGAAEYKALRQRLVSWSTQQGSPSVPAGLAVDFPALRAGDRIGQYCLLEELGRGAMGVVYLAEHTSLKRWVALKLLAGHLLNQADAQSRFRREMEAVGRTNHPNLIHATDAGEIDGHSFLAMDYVPGIDLETLCRTLGPLPASEACEIIAQAATGLQQAHNHQLVHRDVKPSNLLLGIDGTVRVLDLGLALFQPHDEPVLAERADLPRDGAFEDDVATRAGAILGTQAYMAPEQRRDSHIVDFRADIYGLGATFHRLLFGSPPALVLKQQSSPQRRQTWRQMRSDVDESVLILLDQMLNADPAERPAQMSEIADRLAGPRQGCDWFEFIDLIRSKGLASREMPRPGLVQAQLAAVPVESASEPLPRQRTSPLANPLLVGTGVLGCLGICTLGVVLILSMIWVLRQSPPDDVPNVAIPMNSQAIAETRSTADRPTYRSPQLGAPAVHLTPSSFLEIRDSAYLMDGDKPFTVELWIRPTSEASWDSVVMGSAPVNRQPTLTPWGSGWSLQLSQTPIRQTWQIQVDGQPSMGGFPGGLPGREGGLIQGYWHYVVLVRRGSRWEVWVDGRRQFSTTSLPGSPYRSTAVGNLLIGGGSTRMPASGLSMDVAAVRLSQGEVDPSQLMPVFPLSWDDSTVSLLDFSKPDTTVLGDDTGQGHIGKLSAGSWVTVE